jgi:hypothetical protein
MSMYCSPIRRTNAGRHSSAQFARALLSLFLLLCAAFAAHSAVAQADVIGKLRTIRQVLVSKGSVAAGQPGDYAPARDGQGVVAGLGVRTLKRAQAEVDFRDGSVLRVNERSDLIVEDSPSLRNVHLTGGVVWIHVAKGVHTQVETPSATAVARGTIFTVAYLPNGTTILTVLEGTVDITTGGTTVSVGAGQQISVNSNGAVPPVYSVPANPSAIPAGELPITNGGGADPWYLQMANNLGVAVTSGTSAVLDLRTSTLGESLQELSSAGVSGSAQDFFYTVTDQQLLFHAAQGTLIQDLHDSGLTPTQYQTQYGNESLVQGGFTADQITALNGLGITTVGQALTALSQNGVNLNISIPTGRAQYAPNQPNFDYRPLDRNETSLSFVGVGAALALAADAKNLKFPLPTFSGQAFGFLADPDLLGARARVDGYISGKTHYALEGNVLRILTGPTQRTASKPDSVFVVEQAVTDHLTVFAGRNRFYEGPVFQDEVSSQLIADRYTGTGVTYRADGLKFDGAYLYDSNPNVHGAQHGALASVTARTGAGSLGVNYLNVSGAGYNSGYTVHGTYPVVPGTLEVYAEAGKSPEKATLQTYGGYFPGLYQKTDLDLFVEYGSREGVGHALSFIVNKDIKKVLDLRAYASFRGKSGDVKGGLAAIFKFSSR